MSETLRNIVLAPGRTDAEIGRLTRDIYEQTLRDSKHMQGGDFTVFSPLDLMQMFDRYDEHFFAGECRKTLGDSLLTFRISRRMTKAGGQTSRSRVPHPQTGAKRTHYEITVSSTLLFQTFGDVDRAVRVTGILCADRLEAMQRIMEHEIVHLIEMELWTDSKCSEPRFQGIASRQFGHTQHTHQLITPRERAFTKFGLQTGDRVAFEFEGVKREGVINRITKRATVLVVDPAGETFSDGLTYRKFYVPVEFLRRIDRS